MWYNHCCMLGTSRSQSISEIRKAEVKLPQIQIPIQWMNKFWLRRLRWLYEAYQVFKKGGNIASLLSIWDMERSDRNQDIWVKQIFNAIICLEFIQCCVNTSIIKPIYKGNGKNLWRPEVVKVWLFCQFLPRWWSVSHYIGWSLPIWNKILHISSRLHVNKILHVNMPSLLSHTHWGCFRTEAQTSYPSLA